MPGIDSIALRDASAADAPALLRLNAASVERLSPLDAPALERLLAQCALARVATAGGDVVGMVLALREGADYGSPNYRWFAAREARSSTSTAWWWTPPTADAASPAGCTPTCSRMRVPPECRDWPANTTSTRRIPPRHASMPRRASSRSAVRCSRAEKRCRCNARPSADR